MASNAKAAVLAQSEDTGIVNVVNIPGFIQKLWTMLNEPSNSHVIGWSQSGDTFLVHDQKELESNVIGKYFKHNKFSSLVRQLNMYGFHKVNVATVTKKSKESKDSDEWEFVHPFVQRAKPSLLQNIKRKPDISSKTKPAVETNEHMLLMLNDLTVLKHEHLQLVNKYDGLERQNECLWSDLERERIRHDQQQTKIEKIMRYLTALQNGSAKLPLEVDVSYSIEPKIRAVKRQRLDRDYETGSDTGSTNATPTCAAPQSAFPAFSSQEVPYASTSCADTSFSSNAISSDIYSANAGGVTLQQYGGGHPVWADYVHNEDCPVKGLQGANNHVTRRLSTVQKQLEDHVHPAFLEGIFHEEFHESESTSENGSTESVETAPLKLGSDIAGLCPTHLVFTSLEHSMTLPDVGDDDDLALSPDGLDTIGILNGH